MPRNESADGGHHIGHHVYREYGVDPLERHFIAEVMTREAITVDANLPVRDVQHRYFGIEQTQRAYPVVSDGKLLGVVDRNRLSRIPAEQLDQRVGDLFAAETASFALPTETCRAVASRLAAFGLERLAVVDSADSLHLLGIVSRSDLLRPTRQLYEDEIRREKFF